MGGEKTARLGYQKRDIIGDHAGVGVRDLVVKDQATILG